MFWYNQAVVNYITTPSLIKKRSALSYYSVQEAIAETIDNFVGIIGGKTCDILSKHLSYP
jgi:hypothetical protein